LTSILQKGVAAPQFQLRADPERSVSLQEFLGKPLVIAFYPADWSPVCGEQMTLYNEVLPEFRRRGAEVVGISVDGAWCHRAFAADRKIHFLLLADFEPKGAVAKRYGAYRELDGTCERAIFVLDPRGRVYWSFCAAVDVNPGADSILDALELLDKEGR
jgi:peroxiredoxin